MKQPATLTRRTGLLTGLTLIETMVATAVLGTLVALAAPSFAHIGARYKADGLQAELVGALQATRAEAVMRGQTVALRRHTHCPAAESPPDWRCGWEIFVDRDRDGVRGSDELLITTHGPAEGHQIRLEGPDPDRISYSPLGRTEVPTQSFFIQTEKAGQLDRVARRLCIGYGGTRLRAIESSQTC